MNDKLIPSCFHRWVKCQTRRNNLKAKNLCNYKKLPLRTRRTTLSQTKQL